MNRCSGLSKSGAPAHLQEHRHEADSIYGAFHGFCLLLRILGVIVVEGFASDGVLSVLHPNGTDGGQLE